MVNDFLLFLMTNNVKHNKKQLGNDVIDNFVNLKSLFDIFNDNIAVTTDSSFVKNSFAVRNLFILLEGLRKSNFFDYLHLKLRLFDCNEPEFKPALLLY